MMRRSLVCFLMLGGLAACGDKAQEGGNAPAAAPPKAPASAPAAGYGYAAALGADLDVKVGDAMKAGRKYLLAQKDEASGGFGKPELRAGMTAFAALALVATTARESVAGDPTITQALELLAAAQEASGAIHSNPAYTNYETAVAVSAFANARIAKFASVQAKARDFIAASQIADDQANLSYGGFPYTSKSDPSRPADLSNAQFAATAATDAGLAKDHPMWGRLLAYLARVQNRSEANPIAVKKQDKDVGAEIEIVSGNDGGAAYAPAFSMAGNVKREDGKYAPKSYGSMTYALLKCLLFAGAKPDDPRVAAAVAWISKNFALDRNPGFETSKDPEQAGQQGYYYYLLTAARALAEYERASGKPIAVTDDAGKAHDWRKEIAQQLLGRQSPDGAWKNPQSPRWEEGDPLLVTCYALQTLAICQGRLP